MVTNKELLKSALIISVSFLLLMYVVCYPAKALSTKETKKGLIVDVSIVIDGVTWKRFRDPQAGTLCYVTSIPAPAISCVGWEP